MLLIDFKWCEQKYLSKRFSEITELDGFAKIGVFRYLVCILSDI